MITPEQKRAIQSLLLDELRQTSESNPTMLFDVLASGQGLAWIYHVVNLQHGRHTQLSQMTAHLLAALKGSPTLDFETAADEKAA